MIYGISYSYVEAPSTLQNMVYNALIQQHDTPKPILDIWKPAAFLGTIFFRWVPSL
jgi:hypothetical protein